jgi:tRNA-splicing ligase RtcB
MKKVISTEKIPIKLWLDDIEEGALQQARNLANLPFGFKWISIMPDSHQGFGMPIGGVMATKGIVVPNAVGVDIGCGMCAVKTSLTEIDQEKLKKIMGRIRKEIPVGFSHHKSKQNEDLMPKFPSESKPDWDVNLMPVCVSEYENALKQIGTLGGGNHFIEIQKGSDGHIWLMIHSGSRNFGLKIAKHYNDLAIELNKKWHTQVPHEWKLAFLPMDSKEGYTYLREMQYAVDFALANRKLMMDRIQNIVNDVCWLDLDNDLPDSSPLVVDEMINIAHNYAKMENHFSENVLVHRKGATLATEKTIGIIPGSMGTSSYIVQGLGNPESFNSCSHGAGRKMSRKKAISDLNLEEEQKKMTGILGAPRNKDELEEAPGAYKDIDVVMENQKDLVKILVELKPLAVIKG